MNKINFEIKFTGEIEIENVSKMNWDLYENSDCFVYHLKKDIEELKGNLVSINSNVDVNYGSVPRPVTNLKNVNKSTKQRGE
jgi:hypothetical protein